MSMGVPKSENTLMNTSRELASMVGITRGTIICITRWNAVQPRLSAASFKELSRFLRAPEIYMYTRGKDWRENTSTMPANP